MLLGALMLHGIRPGPMLQVEHPGLVALIAVIMTFATVFLFVNGMLLTKMFAVILTVSPKILMPIIGVLCVLGVYSYNNNAFHLVLVFVFGILGYLMNKMDYAPAPIVLGLILGGLADSYFRRALFIQHGSLIHLINRPISFLLFAVCIATVLNQFGFFNAIKQRYKSSEKDSG
jgi:putative tricarboxylic transport membrane protein